MAYKSGTSLSKLFVIGLDSRKKQRHFASVAAGRTEKPDPAQLLSTLKKMREDALNQMSSLTQQFLDQAGKDEHIRVFMAEDAVKAVEYITRVKEKKKVLAINRSGVLNELEPLLAKNDFDLIDTYFSDKSKGEPVEKVLNYFWQLPKTPPESAFEAFTVQEQESSVPRKDYTALLGVTAASADDGSICFLQHSANVGEMIQEARQLILIVGLDKIVRTKDEALFQTKCMGTFGLESVILNLKPPGHGQPFAEMEKPECGNIPQEVHVIVLDNGRRDVARDENFNSLLTCISCRACSKNCPMISHFGGDTVNFPRKYLWSYLLGSSSLLDMCIGCGMCRFNCPLDEAAHEKRPI